MAHSLLKLLCFNLFVFLLAFPVALAHDYSILGYSPEDLSSEETLLDRFLSWMSEYHKVYKRSSDMEYRFEVFKDNLNYIHERNKMSNSYWLGLNEFADLTHEEFVQTHLGEIEDDDDDDDAQISQRTYGNFTSADFESMPKAIDWRERGAVTPVKNQGSCGSCWAFAAADNVESVFQIKTGWLYTLSPQHLVDCDRVSSGCNGGHRHWAYDFIKSNGGIHLEWDYPYVARQQTCQQKPAWMLKIPISGYVRIPVNNEQMVLAAIAQQPVGVSLESRGRDFQLYKAGVFDGPCGTRLGHSVLAVGYGTTADNKDYIILKNSWGASWGENGYMRIRRNTGIPQGLCGLYMRTNYPVV